MTKLTVIIPTLNEESNIQRALDSVFFADEIIVIDSYSSDKTVKIVKKNNVTLLQRKFDDFSSQKNYAIQKASNDWVLIVDADEEVTVELSKEIKEIFSKELNYVGFYIRRNSYVENKRLQFGGYSSKIVRLFNKKYCFYKGVVHETIQATGRLENLTGRINHYTYKDYTHFKKKMNYYAKLRAQELFAKEKKVTIIHLYIKPFIRFLIHYIFKLGFLDGKEGIIFSYLMAYGVAKRYKELTLLNNK